MISCLLEIERRLGFGPPFTSLAAGWRLDWDPPSFAGPFFSIAVAIFVFQQVGSAAKVLDRELVSNRFYWSMANYWFA